MSGLSLVWAVGALVLLLVLLAGALALSLRDLYRVYAPIRWISQGRYAEARALCEKPWWLKRFKSVRAASEYNVAVCMFYSGELEATLAKISSLPSEGLPRNLAVTRNNLQATTLLLLGREPERAAHLLAEIPVALMSASDRMGLALALWRAGNAQAAEAEAAQAESAQALGVTWGLEVVLVRAAELEASCYGLMRGLYHVERGEPELAASHLERAARSSLPSVYRTMAAASVPPLPAPVEPEPSTLAPLVLKDRN